MASLILTTLVLGVSQASADDCAALGGAVNAAGECQITTDQSASPKQGTFNIAGPLRITYPGNIVVTPASANPASQFILNVAGNLTIDAPPIGSAFAITGNGGGTTAVGATVTIQASGNILLDGNAAGTVGAQIRSNGASTCSGSGRAGTISLISSTGNVVLKAGSKVFATGGCLGGEVVLRAPSGNVEVSGRIQSKAGGTTSTIAVVRGGPITLAAANALTIGPGGSVSSEGTVTGAFPNQFNYGADRVHLESGGNMVIQGIVQSVGGFKFGLDVFGAKNRCTGDPNAGSGLYRIGKPATPTSCVEVWVGGTLSVNGGDPSDPTNKMNGYISARSGQSGLNNGTCCSWIDVYVIGDIVLKGQPTAVSTNGFLIDSQQASSNATGGTITMFAVRGKVTTSGRTFIADGATGAGGTGGNVIVEAAGPVDYAPLPPGQFHAPDSKSNVDLGDSMQYARGANVGGTGGAGKIHMRSWNGQITGGPVAHTEAVAPGTVRTLTFAAGTLVYPSAGTYTFLDGRTVVVQIAVQNPGQIDESVVQTFTFPNGASLSGGCADRYTGAPIYDATGARYPCNEFTGVIDGGGVGVTELIINLCVGWLYNGVTRPIAVTFDPVCGGRPKLPDDVIIPIAPTIQIYGGRYRYDGLERPATGDATSGFVLDGTGHRVAVVFPRAYGQAGLSEPLLPLPTVTYVDANNNPVAVPIQVGTYTATATFPGNAQYVPLTATAPIIIFDVAPVVTVTGGIYRYDGQPHPATGVTTTDADNPSISITTPPTVVYYYCTFNPTPSWTPATDPSCKTTPPVNVTTTKLPPNVTLDDGIPVLAYFPGNATYGPASAAAKIAIWQPRPSITTATGGTFPYDGQPHATTTAVKDGGTDGLGTTYPTTAATVDTGTFTFGGKPSGVTYTVSPDPSTVHAVGVDAPVNVGTYPVTAVYPGDAIHSASSGTNTIVIVPRPVTIAVPSVSYACDGAPHPATGSITYTTTGGVTVSLGSPLFTYMDSTGRLLDGPPSTYGTYTVTAGLPLELAGNNAATPPTVTATLTIIPKNTTMTAVGGTFAYDGNAHPATGTVVFNKTVIDTPAFTYTKGGVVIVGAPVDVGTYTATAGMSPQLAGCYTGTPVSTTVTITAAPAAVTVVGGTYFYDGQPHPAFGTVSLNGTMVSTPPTITYTLNGVVVGTPTQVGVYTATATLPSQYTNGYTATPATAAVTIKDRSCAPVDGGGYSFTSIEYPANQVATTVYDMNAAGQIVGTFVDSTSTGSGFWLSSPTGSYAPPISAGAAVGAVSTTVYGVNASGQIAGTYFDAGVASHGFLLTGTTSGTGGTFTPIDASSLGAVQTAVYNVNDAGQIAGAYIDASGKSHGFTVSGITFAPVTGIADLHSAVFTTVDATNLGAAETAVYGISNAGQVVGAYVDAAGHKHGFSVKFVGGNITDVTGATFTTIDYPDAVATRAYGLDDVGTVVGSYDDADGIQHGFKWVGGTFSTIDAGECGTEVHCITNSGQICGSYKCDKPGGTCGFVSNGACKKVTIGPSTMEGSIKLDAGDWVSGGYSFKTTFPKPGNITITASVTITGKCIGGTKTTDSFTVSLGTKTYTVPAGSTSDWLPTGDANSVLSWMGSGQVPATICGGGQLDGSKGAVFTANVSAFPAQPFGTVTFRFKYRDPAAKGKPNTNCLDTNDPNRAKADVCGASWSSTLTSSSDCDGAGAFTTYTPGGWGAVPSGSNPGTLLATNFSKVYPGGSVSIGIGNSLTFTSASAVTAFLPIGSTAGVLTASATNPTTSSGGVFAGQLLSAQLSLDFSNTGVTRRGFGSLQMMSGALTGWTVAQIIALGNTVIGGNIAALPAGLTITGLNSILDTINNNFDNGTTNKGNLK